MTDYGEIALVALIGGGITIGLGFLTGLFKRTVNAEDSRNAEMRADVKNILLEVRSLREEQIRHSGEIGNLRERVARVEGQALAAHRRLDERFDEDEK